MKKALRIIGLIILLVLIIGFFFPAENQFTKSKVIDASPEIVFGLVNDLKNWPKWSPWIKAEPNMELKYGEKTAGLGAEYSWHGKSMGDGKLWITESLTNEKVVTQIDFGAGEPSQGVFTLRRVEKGTEVNWQFINNNGWNPVSRIIGGVFIAPMVADSYVEGLNYLDSAAITASKASVDMDIMIDLPTVESDTIVE